MESVDGAKGAAMLDRAQGVDKDRLQTPHDRRPDPRFSGNTDPP